MKKRMYIAAPLFSAAEIEFNKKIKSLLIKYYDVYLPQEDGGLMSEFIKFGMDSRKAASLVYQKDIDELKKCDLLLIILDGRTIDEGAAFELGYFTALNKPSYGLQTDTRRLINNKNNPMIEQPLLEIFSNTNELINWVVRNNQLSKETVVK